ncbi:hypothetical protein C0995_009288 [Termitomyces sp. Mi166|nr:hypothetical protein C0995_009288 [Termitomyces sp. Mi166\
MKKLNSKPLQAKDSIITAQNLYVIDYLATHPNATKGDFATVWKSCDAEIKKKYQELSKVQTKAKKNRIEQTETQSHITSLLSFGTIKLVFSSIGGSSKDLGSVDALCSALHCKETGDSAKYLADGHIAAASISPALNNFLIVSMYSVIASQQKYGKEDSE